MADSQEWAGPPFRSRSCSEGTHGDCGHLGVIIRGRAPRSSPVVLCVCGCHSACPLVNRGPVPRAVWERQCTCPGTQQARTRLDTACEERPDFAEFRERSRRERQDRRAARGEAFDAARAAAAGGRAREQVREVYEAELRARGLPVPPDQVLDAYADAIAGDRRGTLVRFTGLVLTWVGKDLRELRNAFRNVRVFRDGD
jgi:hypothetical protein